MSGDTDVIERALKLLCFCAAYTVAYQAIVNWL